MEPIPLSPWLAHLAEHIPIAREGSDPEGVHQVRVAAGRIDVWLGLAGLRVLRDDLGWMRGGAGRLRELDVLLASSPPAPWVPWLEERRAAQRRDFLAILGHRRLAGLLSALALLPPLAPGRAAEGMERLVRRARRRGARVEEEPGDVERYHALRKALRRVRYAKEWLGEDTRAIRALQQSLGEMNDDCVALELLQRWPESASLPEERAALLEKIDRERKRSLKRWRRGPLEAEARS